MDNSFLVLMLSGRTENVIAERFELVTEPKSKRLVYQFYSPADETSSRCFFTSEDIVAIIPSDMHKHTPCAN